MDDGDICFRINIEMNIKRLEWHDIKTLSLGNKGLENGYVIRVDDENHLNNRLSSYIMFTVPRDKQRKIGIIHLNFIIY